MIYRSNLTCPDLQPCFQHLYARPMSYAQNHTILSDFADYSEQQEPELAIHKVCGFQTHDEAAILYQIAKSIKGTWLDIGGHTGWTSAHMSVAGCLVTALDPMYVHPLFRRRAFENLLTVHTTYPDSCLPMLVPFSSDEYFTCLKGRPISFDGIMIDGDHEEVSVMNDARQAACHIKDSGVIMFHDVLGSPQRAVEYLIGCGFQAKIYFTPHMVACCWKSLTWHPPDHVPDPVVDWAKVTHRMGHLLGTEF